VYATHCPGDECYAYVPILQERLHLVDPPAPIDWAAIVKLAQWLQALPVRLGDRGPAVKTLNDLLVKRGHPEVAGTAYGTHTQAAVHRLKVEWAWSNLDGKVVGKPFGTELVTHK
jgi:hypothetical protein